MSTIPYKTYLNETELPEAWYNVRADMKKKPAPLLDPTTLKPVDVSALERVFCRELAAQELDDTSSYIEIPGEIRDFYRMFRPSPLIRAYFLEKALGTPAEIYYKFEGNNTSGSHKLNSAVAQAYYAKAQGLKGVTTETGAGQWGTALSMACSFFGLDCRVYMVKCSYEQKPHRREVMRTYGAAVTPSPSMTTEVGRRINAAHPGATGSLGCAISEAVEDAVNREGYRYVLGSVLNQVLLHQSIIGLETKAALDKLGVKPDIVIGCAGGGSNLGGLVSPFMGEMLRGENSYRFAYARTLRIRLLRHGARLSADEDVYARTRLYAEREPRGRAQVPRNVIHAVGASRPGSHGGDERHTDPGFRGGENVRPHGGHSARARVGPCDSRRGRRGR